MIRRAGALAAAASAVAVAAALLAPSVAQAAPAASPSLLQVSSDGIHFDQTLTLPVFDPSTRMIPRSSQAGVLWVRNASTEAAYLRVVIGGVRGSDAHLLGALSIAADTPGAAGRSVSLTDANPCYVLTQGDLLAPGDSIRIDTGLTLGDLVAAEGQSATVAFDLQIGLSSVDPLGTAPTACIKQGVVVPVFGGPTTQTPAGGGAGGVSTGGYAGTPNTPDTVPTAPETDEPQTIPEFVMTALNTARLFQEDFVALWILGAAIGSLLMLIIARRRRRADEKNGVRT